MTKFIKWPHVSGVDYQRAQIEESHRYHIVNINNNKEAYSNRKPRRDSKFFSFNFMVWDSERNCQVNA